MHKIRLSFCDLVCFLLWSTYWKAVRLYRGDIHNYDQLSRVAGDLGKSTDLDALL